MRYLIVALLFIAPFAHAQTGLKWNESGMKWDAPTTCTDGSPISDCPVTGYRVETAPSCTAPTWTLAGLTAASVLSFKATGLTAGPHCFRVKATSANGDSVASNTLLQMATPPLPGPPSNLTESDTVAYELRSESDGALVASIIGRLPAGSLCTSETREVNGQTYHRVDPSRVDLWTPTALPVDAWASCASAGG